MGARLIPLLLLLVAFLIVLIARQQARTPRPRSDRSYRPRAQAGARSAAAGWGDAADSSAVWVVDRSELDGVRDAYSSAALDAAKPLYRCAGCQAYYQRASLDALRSQNHGRCVLCASSDLRPVQVR
ncbi:MAG TPA: hypothetical protein VIW70_14590 [Rubrivivax sp.]